LTALLRGTMKALRSRLPAPRLQTGLLSTQWQELVPSSGAELLLESHRLEKKRSVVSGKGWVGCN
jgi:hypothetical protein